MSIAEIIAHRANDPFGSRQVTIAFMGDSVTHGCFELYRSNEVLCTVFDLEAGYHNRLKQILTFLYPSVPFTIVNAGINGDNAPAGLSRLERDVLSYRPDMVVVCYGLNDVSKGAEAVMEYTDALRDIMRKVREAGAEVIFITPNMRAVKVNGDITDDEIRGIAQSVADSDLNGDLERYVNAARRLCAEEDVLVCDCYAVWRALERRGVDVSRLLSNGINHPAREMHLIFACELVKTIMMEA